MERKTPEGMSVRFPFWSFLVIVLSSFVFAVDTLPPILIYEYNGIMDGEYWRLISGHFVHFSIFHLGFNIVLFGISGWYIEQRRYPGFVLLIFVSALIIGISMMILNPYMQFYGGLSGIAHGTLYYLALFSLRESKLWGAMSWLIIIVVPLKVAMEMVMGGSPLTYVSTETFIPVPLSHMMGIVTALLQFYGIKVLNGKAVKIR